MGLRKPLWLPALASGAPRSHSCERRRQGTSCAESAVPKTDAQRDAVQLPAYVQLPVDVPLLQLLQTVLPAQLR